MSEEEINAILQMECPEYYRAGVRIFPNGAGGVSIHTISDSENELIHLETNNIKEICEVLLAFAKWLNEHSSTLDFIEEKKGDRQ